MPIDEFGGWVEEDEEERKRRLRARGLAVVETPKATAVNQVARPDPWVNRERKTMREYRAASTANARLLYPTKKDPPEVFRSMAQAAREQDENNRKLGPVAQWRMMRNTLGDVGVVNRLEAVDRFVRYYMPQHHQREFVAKLASSPYSTETLRVMLETAGEDINGSGKYDAEPIVPQWWATRFGFAPGPYTKEQEQEINIAWRMQLGPLRYYSQTPPQHGGPMWKRPEPGPNASFIEKANYIIKKLDDSIDPFGFIRHTRVDLLQEAGSRAEYARRYNIFKRSGMTNLEARAATEESMTRPFSTSMLARSGYTPSGEELPEGTLEAYGGGLENWDPFDYTDEEIQQIILGVTPVGKVLGTAGKAISTVIPRLGLAAKAGTVAAKVAPGIRPVLTPTINLVAKTGAPAAAKAIAKDVGYEYQLWREFTPAGRYIGRAARSMVAIQPMQFVKGVGQALASDELASTWADVWTGRAAVTPILTEGTLATRPILRRAVIGGTRTGQIAKFGVYLSSSMSGMYAAASLKQQAALERDLFRSKSLAEQASYDSAYGLIDPAIEAAVYNELPGYSEWQAIDAYISDLAPADIRAAMKAYQDMGVGEDLPIGNVWTPEWKIAISSYVTESYSMVYEWQTFLKSMSFAPSNLPLTGDMTSPEWMAAQALYEKNTTEHGMNYILHPQAEAFLRVTGIPASGSDYAVWKNATFKDGHMQNAINLLMAPMLMFGMLHLGALAALDLETRKWKDMDYKRKEGALFDYVWAQPLPAGGPFVEKPDRDDVNQHYVEYMMRNSLASDPFAKELYNDYKGKLYRMVSTEEYGQAVMWDLGIALGMDYDFMHKARMEHPAAILATNLAFDVALGLYAPLWRLSKSAFGPSVVGRSAAAFMRSTEVMGRITNMTKEIYDRGSMNNALRAAGPGTQNRDAIIDAVRAVYGNLPEPGKVKPGEEKWSFHYNSGVVHRIVEQMEPFLKAKDKGGMRKLLAQPDDSLVDEVFKIYDEVVEAGPGQLETMASLRKVNAAHEQIPTKGIQGIDFENVAASRPSFKRNSKEYRAVEDRLKGGELDKPLTMEIDPVNGLVSMAVEDAKTLRVALDLGWSHIPIQTNLVDDIRIGRPQRVGAGITMDRAAKSGFRKWATNNGYRRGAVDKFLRGDSTIDEFLATHDETTIAKPAAAPPPPEAPPPVAAETKPVKPRKPPAQARADSVAGATRRRNARGQFVAAAEAEAAAGKTPRTPRGKQKVSSIDEELEIDTLTDDEISTLSFRRKAKWKLEVGQLIRDTQRNKAYRVTKVAKSGNKRWSMTIEPVAVPRARRATKAPTVERTPTVEGYEQIKAEQAEITRQVDEIHKGMADIVAEGDEAKLANIESTLLVLAKRLTKLESSIADLDDADLIDEIEQTLTDSEVIVDADASLADRKLADKMDPAKKRVIEERFAKMRVAKEPEGPIEPRPPRAPVWRAEPGAEYRGLQQDLSGAKELRALVGDDVFESHFGPKADMADKKSAAMEDTEWKLYRLLAMLVTGSPNVQSLEGVASVRTTVKRLLGEKVEQKWVSHEDIEQARQATAPGPEIQTEVTRRGRQPVSKTEMHRLLTAPHHAGTAVPYRQVKFNNKEITAAEGGSTVTITRSSTRKAGWQTATEGEIVGQYVPMGDSGRWHYWEVADLLVDADTGKATVVLDRLDDMPDGVSEGIPIPEQRVGGFTAEEATVEKTYVPLHETIAAQSLMLTETGEVVSPAQAIRRIEAAIGDFIKVSKGEVQPTLSPAEMDKAAHQMFPMVKPRTKVETARAALEKLGFTNTQINELMRGGIKDFNQDQAAWRLVSASGTEVLDAEATVARSVESTLFHAGQLPEPVNQLITRSVEGAVRAIASGADDGSAIAAARQELRDAFDAYEPLDTDFPLQTTFGKYLAGDVDAGTVGHYEGIRIGQTESNISDALMFQVLDVLLSTDAVSTVTRHTPSSIGAVIKKGVTNRYGETVKGYKKWDVSEPVITAIGEHVLRLMERDGVVEDIGDVTTASWWDNSAFGPMTTIPFEPVARVEGLLQAFDALRRADYYGPDWQAFDDIVESLLPDLSAKQLPPDQRVAIESRDFGGNEKLLSDALTRWGLEAGVLVDVNGLRYADLTISTTKQFRTTRGAKEWLASRAAEYRDDAVTQLKTLMLERATESIPKGLTRVTRREGGITYAEATSKLRKVLKAPAEQSIDPDQALKVAEANRAGEAETAAYEQELARASAEAGEGIEGEPQAMATSKPPPVPDGHIRLYRGRSNRVTPEWITFNEKAKGRERKFDSWTDSLEEAEYERADIDEPQNTWIEYIDIPAEEAAKYRVGSAAAPQQRNAWFMGSMKVRQRDPNIDYKVPKDRSVDAKRMGQQPTPAAAAAPTPQPAAAAPVIAAPTPAPMPTGVTGRRSSRRQAPPPVSTAPPPLSPGAKLAESVRAHLVEDTPVAAPGFKAQWYTPGAKAKLSDILDSEIPKVKATPQGYKARKMRQVVASKHDSVKNPIIPRSLVQTTLTEKFAERWVKGHSVMVDLRAPTLAERMLGAPDTNIRFFRWRDTIDSLVENVRTPWARSMFSAMANTIHHAPMPEISYGHTEERARLYDVALLASQDALWAERWVSRAMVAKTDVARSAMNKQLASMIDTRYLLESYAGVPSSVFEKFIMKWYGANKALDHFRLKDRYHGQGFQRQQMAAPEPRVYVRTADGSTVEASASVEPGTFRPSDVDNMTTFMQQFADPKRRGHSMQALPDDSFRRASWQFDRGLLWAPHARPKSSHWLARGFTFNRNAFRQTMYSLHIPSKFARRMAVALGTPLLFTKHAVTDTTRTALDSGVSSVAMAHRIEAEFDRVVSELPPSIRDRIMAQRHETNVSLVMYNTGSGWVAYRADAIFNPNDAYKPTDLEAASAALRRITFGTAFQIWAGAGGGEAGLAALREFFSTPRGKQFLVRNNWVRMSKSLEIEAMKNKLIPVKMSADGKRYVTKKGAAFWEDVTGLYETKIVHGQWEQLQRQMPDIFPKLMKSANGGYIEDSTIRAMLDGLDDQGRRNNNAVLSFVEDDDYSGSFINKVIGKAMAPNKWNRKITYDAQFNRNLAMLKKAYPDADIGDLAHTAGDMAQLSTERIHFDLANMLNVEAKYRWFAWFATKHRLYTSWLLRTGIARPGMVMALAELMDYIEKKNDAMPEVPMYRRHQINFYLPDWLGGGLASLNLAGIMWLNHYPLESLMGQALENRAGSFVNYVAGQEIIAPVDNPFGLSIVRGEEIVGSAWTYMRSPFGWLGPNSVTKSSMDELSGETPLSTEGVTVDDIHAWLDTLDPKTRERISEGANLIRVIDLAQGGSGDPVQAMNLYLLGNIADNVWMSGRPLPMNFPAEIGKLVMYPGQQDEIIEVRQKADHYWELANSDEPGKASEYLMANLDLQAYMHLHMDPTQAYELEEGLRQLNELREAMQNDLLSRARSDMQALANDVPDIMATYWEDYNALVEENPSLQEWTQAQTNKKNAKQANESFFKMLAISFPSANTKQLIKGAVSDDPEVLANFEAEFREAEAFELAQWGIRDMNDSSLLSRMIKNRWARERDLFMDGYVKGTINDEGEYTRDAFTTQPSRTAAYWMARSTAPDADKLAAELVDVYRMKQRAKVIHGDDWYATATPEELRLAGLAYNPNTREAWLKMAKRRRDLSIFYNENEIYNKDSKAADPYEAEFEEYVKQLEKDYPGFADERALNSLPLHKRFLKLGMVTGTPKADDGWKKFLELTDQYYEALTKVWNKSYRKWGVGPQAMSGADVGAYFVERIVELAQENPEWTQSFWKSGMTLGSFGYYYRYPGYHEEWLPGYASLEGSAGAISKVGSQ